MKKLFKVIIVLKTTLILCGCQTKNNTSSMIAYTSVYPTEYILENLYGEKIAIYSIYPDGTNYEKYKLTKKQLSDFSNSDLYIYNGNVEKEKNYAVNMINNNKNIKIIDATQGMSFTSDPSEAWLNPSNFLMMASNIKKGLEEYINEAIEINKINDQYDELKLNLSQIDAEFKLIASNSSNKNLIVADDAFNFLEKYGFNVISIEENENLTDKTISDVKKLFSNKTVNYIFVKDGNEENNLIKELKNNYGAQIISLNSLSTLSANDRKDKNDYKSIMLENISLLKTELNN